jgi:hypothetical protein
MRVRRLVVLLLFGLACPEAFAQGAGPAVPLPVQAAGADGILPLDQVPRSQPGAVAQRVATTDITVTYSRPVARGRELFGALVPYGTPWNPGANDATAIRFSRDVQVNGRPLAAGPYSLWVIPRAGVWTVIFSRAADVFHTPYPGESHDALRLDVTPVAGSHVEVLTFGFPHVDGKRATLQLSWGTVAIPLEIDVP